MAAGQGFQTGARFLCRRFFSPDISNMFGLFPAVQSSRVSFRLCEMPRNRLAITSGGGQLEDN